MTLQKPAESLDKTEFQISIPLHVPISSNTFVIEDYLDPKLCRSMIERLRESKTLFHIYHYTKEDDGDTIIHLASKVFPKNPCLSILIEELIKNKKEFKGLINKLNFYGNTALMDAVLRGQLPTVSLLIAAGADINIRNKIGNTAAHIASLNGYLAILQLLIENKINILAKNFEEFTCFDHAQEMGHGEVAEYLEPHIIKAQMWRNKNCLVKIYLNKSKTKKFSRVPNGVFREIIKYA